MPSDACVAPALAEYDAMLFRSLLEHSSLAVGVAGANGRLRMMSRGLQDLVGSSIDGAPASRFPELFHLYDADGRSLLRPEQVPLNRASAGETVRDVVISVRRPGRTAVKLRCDAFPLTGPDGQQIGAIVLVVDITTVCSEAQRQDLIRGMLLDTVNHELRTPLSAVVAGAELIREYGVELPRELQRPLSAIVRGSERLSETMSHVTDLVDLHGVAEPARTSRLVGGLLRPVLDRHRHEAKRRGISFEIECHDTLAWALDPVLTRKGVAALVHNAVVHGPGHSRVTLTAGVANGMLHISVSDRGAGIPVHDRDRVTKPFERGEVSNTGPHRRGLGLPLAQAVAASHGGTLVLENQPDGFTACLVLPGIRPATGPVALRPDTRAVSHSLVQSPEDSRTG